MEDLTGKIVDKYQIIKQIGAGGMAVVYLAKDNLNRYVAIKMIQSDAFSRNDYDRLYKRFMIEAQTVANLRHPNIVEVLAYGEYKGSPYLVMDYISGGTLKQMIGAPVPYSQAASNLAPIADALAYAHQKNVLHRDVKPANILLTKDDKPVLTDFGIAKILEKDYKEGTLTEANMGVGTPEYMAPEQCRGDRTIDGRADVYSMGIILYEMCIGSKPFTGRTPTEIMMKQITGELPKNWDKNAGLPKNAAKVIKKALEKEPDQRYATMAEFAEKLRELSREQVIVSVSGKHRVIPDNDEVTFDGDLPVRPSSDKLVKPKKKVSPIVLALVGAGLLAGAGFLGRDYLPFFKSSPTPTPEPSPTATMIPSTDTPVPTATNTMLPTETNTEVPTVEETPLPTVVNTEVPTAAEILLPVVLSTEEPTATETPLPAATNTEEPTVTETPLPTATDTEEPTATETQLPTATNTEEPTATETPLPTATNTEEPTATETPLPTATNTEIPTATETPLPTATNTPDPDEELRILINSFAADITQFRIIEDAERKDSFKTPVMVKSDNIEKYTSRARAQKNGQEKRAYLKVGDVVTYLGERFDLDDDVMLKVRTQNNIEGYIYMGYLEPIESTLVVREDSDSGLSDPGSMTPDGGDVIPEPTATSIPVPGKNYGHVWDPSKDSEILIGNTISFGIYEDKPLRWFVINIDENGDMVLFSERILKRDSYNAVASIATTWENSDIRKWLNEDFLNETFPELSPQRSILTESLLENGYGYLDNIHPTGETPETKDYVFLLSVPEYVRYQSMIENCDKYSSGRSQTDFWLRSQGFDKTRGVSVSPDINNFLEVSKEKGIRPAIVVNRNLLENYFRSSIPAASANFGHVWDPGSDETILPGYLVEFGSYQGEKLRWIVLDNAHLSIEGRLLLLSEQLVSKAAYHSAASITTTWENSDIRDWLNNTFRPNVFPDYSPEAGAIIETLLETQTVDSVFLLSESEYRSYRTLIEDYDAYRANAVGDSNKYRNSEIWLRTSGKDHTRADSTSLVKSITDASQRRITIVTNTLVTTQKGIRPAIIVDLDSLRNLK